MDSLFLHLNLLIHFHHVYSQKKLLAWDKEIGPVQIQNANYPIPAWLHGSEYMYVVLLIKFSFGFISSLTNVLSVGSGVGWF